MAKALSCYKGYAGMYEFDAEKKRFEGKVYRYGYPYALIGVFMVEKEEDVPLMFKRHVATHYASDEELYPHLTSEQPLSDKDSICTLYKSFTEKVTPS